jgi:uncharacterized protein (UPF0261 family)
MNVTIAPAASIAGQDRLELAKQLSRLSLPEEGRRIDRPGMELHEREEVASYFSQITLWKASKSQFTIGIP